MDRLDAMATLLAAVEGGSLSAASRRLGMPLATVSRKVSDLEAHLGTRLVIRTSRRLTMTEAGQAYVAACRRILNDIGEAERTAAGEYVVPRGRLVVTAPIVFGRLHVLPVVLAFLKAYPEIDVRLVLADRVINLVEDHVDLAVRIGTLPDSSFVAMRVGAVGRVVCASPGYLARRGTPGLLDDLAQHDCVTFDGPMSASSWRFGAGKTAISVPIRSRLTVNTAEAAIDAALADVGITRVLSYQVADAVRTGTLVPILRDHEPPPSPVTLVRTGEELPPLKLRAFLDFAAPRIRIRVAESMA